MNDTTVPNESTMVHPPLSLLFSTLAFSELASNLALFPISASNFYLIGRTQIIHRNLKVILLFQTACISIRGLCRVVQSLYKIVSQDPAASESLWPWALISRMCFFSRNFVFHVLIIERIMATIRSRSYENTKNWWFSVAWLVIGICFATYNTVSKDANAGNSTFLNVTTILLLLLVGILEFILFLFLFFFNKNSYIRNEHNGSQQNLSQRYQLSENIRIGKQLVPALSLHLWNIFMSSIGLSFGYFDWSKQLSANLLAISNASGSFCGLLIELTMIVCHPFLRSDFLALLAKLNPLRSRQIADSSATDPPQNSLPMRNIITDQPMVTTNSADEYFKLLQLAWERPLMQFT